MGTLGAALLAIGGLFLIPYLVREYRRNPYPATQNGMTLRAIHAAAPKNDPIGCPNIEIELAHGAYLRSMHGRSSTGDIVSLGRGASKTLPTNLLDLILGDRRLVVINLPQFGLPPTVEWLDVTVEDAQKRRGTWRVYGLPHLKRILPSTTSLCTQQKVNGIAVAARAWRYPAPDSFNAASPIQCEIKGFVPPSIMSQPAEGWSAEILSVRFEWEAALSTPLAAEMNSSAANIEIEPATPSSVFYASAAKRDDSWSPTVQHTALIEARLSQYDVTVETVTFHNVPLLPFGKRYKVAASGPALITPSGVRVQLYQSTDSSSSINYVPFDVAVGYRVSVEPSFHAPATRFKIRSAIRGSDNTCQRVVNNYVSVPRASHSNQRIEGSNHAYLIGLKNLRKSVLPALTISVAFQKERRSMPLTFVVPVEAARPKTLWNKK